MTRSAPIAELVHCSACGYNLVGLTLDSVCPECAASIEVSVRKGRLSLSELAYVSGVRRGAWLVQVGTIAGVVGLVMGVLASMGITALDPTLGPWTPNLLGGVEAAAYGVSLAGWWRFAAPERHGETRIAGTPWRVIARTTAVLRLAAGVPMLVVIHRAVPFAWAVAVVGVFAVDEVAKMMLVRSMARRLRDVKSVRGAIWLSVLGPLLWSVGMPWLIGPVVGVIAQYALMERVREGLERVEETRLPWGFGTNDDEPGEEG